MRRGRLLLLQVVVAAVLVLKWLPVRLVNMVIGGAMVWPLQPQANFLHAVGLIGKVIIDVRVALAGCSLRVWLAAVDADVATVGTKIVVNHLKP